MRYSVVIPARNSARTIGGTLKALRGGARQPDEIIVVDGCSTDDTAEAARRCGARVVVNEKQHVAAARQLGTESALHDVVVFTDSDCLPAMDWLMRVAAHFESDSGVDGVGGRVTLGRPRNRIQQYSAHVFEKIMQFPEKTTLVEARGMPGSFAGANCAFLKTAILSVGGFRDAFTNHAEEIDLFWRLIERKSKLLFDPSIVVEHLEYADTVRRLVRTNFNYGVASTKLAKHHIGWQVDFKLHGLLLKSLFQLLNPLSEDEWAGLRALQLATFFSGKLYASVKLRTLNL